MNRRTKIVATIGPASEDEATLRAMIRAEKSWAQKLALALFGPALVRRYPFEELFFLPLAQVIRAAVDLPLILLGGVASGASMQRAMDEGFEFVGLGRALISDPDLVTLLHEDPNTAARCIHCNRCVAQMSQGIGCALAEDGSLRG